MKKLMIAAAIVCAAVASQAAVINWKTGTLIKPDGSTTAAANTLSLCVFILQDDAAGTPGGMTAAQKYAALDIADIWGTYGKDTVADLKSSATYSATGSGSTGVTATQPDADVAANTTYYAVILSAYDKDLDGTIDLYAANKTIAETNGSSALKDGNKVVDLSKTIGGKGSSLGSVTWEAAAVPEPTSAMLLLLGVAGLALKRKRA